MDRNKLLYFIVGGALIGVGYAARVTQVDNYYRSSTILIVMGLFFIFAILLKNNLNRLTLLFNVCINQNLTLSEFPAYSFFLAFQPPTSINWSKSCEVEKVFL